MINTIEHEEEIIREQVVLDEHDDHVMTLSSSIHCLLNHLSMSVLSPKYTPVSIDHRSIAARRLHQIQDQLSVVSDNPSTTPTEDYDIHQIEEEAERCHFKFSYIELARG